MKAQNKKDIIIKLLGSDMSEDMIALKAECEVSYVRQIQKESQRKIADNFKKIKVGAPTILSPNYEGVLVRETQKMFVIKLTKRTFKSKSSATFTHKFSKSDREWFSEQFTQRECRFWKATGREVGGDLFLPNSSLFLLKH
jgi:hypothetical protein